MSQPLEPLRMLATLRSHGVEFVLVGGVAAAARGGALELDDVDVCIAGDLENLRAMSRALRSMGAAPIGEDAAERSTYDTAWGPLDVFDGGDAYAGLAERATTEDLGHGVSARVASADDLMALKRRTDDLAAIVNLATLHRRDEPVIRVGEDVDEDEFGPKREQRDWPHWLDRLWTAFEDVDGFLNKKVYGDAR